jgi:GntR family transcriptional regulator
MLLKLDTASSEPVYLQIIRAIKLQIASGRLKAGERLPAVRELALMLLVNPNTVQKAYTALANAGLIQTRKGTGVFVGEIRSVLNAEECTRRSLKATDHYIADMLMLGMDHEQIKELVAKRARIFARGVADEQSDRKA